MRLKMQPEWEIAGKKNLPSIKQEDLPPGAKGNLTTIEKMRSLAHKRAGHPKIRTLALAILNHAETKSADDLAAENIQRQQRQ